VGTRRIDVGDVRLAIREEGDGAPVVLLHGFPELSHSWRHQLPPLAAAGYHAIAPDLRGYGDSDAPPEVADYALPALVGDIHGLIRALGHDSAHVVGHDWGGSIAWVLASRAPHAVRSLTILNSPHPVASAEARQIPEQQQKSWYMLLFQFAGIAEQWLANDDFANLRRFVFDTAAPAAFPPEDRAVFCDALARPGRLTAALNYYRANIPPENWLKPPPDLPPVEVPTTIIWAEADAYMSPILLERSVAKVAGRLRVERLPGVSHWAQQEAPEAVTRAIVASLRRAEQSQARA
jgi:pimeloyl-ACP methyl ester carboxylesterase